MKKLTLIALLVFIKSIGNAQQLEVANRNSPNKVGERIITFQCPTEGIPQKDIEVWVYYSDSKEQLSKSDCPHGRATCKKNTSAPSKLDCKFYLPHSDHMTPNYILPQEKSSGQAVSESDMNEYLSSSSGSVQNMVLMSSITDKNPKSYNNPKKVYYKIVRERKAAKKTSEILNSPCLAYL
ncbi:MAG: hypothetical protein IPN36_14785 [Bacteroidetes bacterium]|nr:hypothetical protein [Bacteroidota bacterium]